MFFQARNALKTVFGRGFAPDPTGGAYDAPPDPLVGWGGGYPCLAKLLTKNIVGLFSTHAVELTQNDLF